MIKPPIYIQFTPADRTFLADGLYQSRTFKTHKTTGMQAAETDHPLSHHFYPSPHTDVDLVCYNTVRMLTLCKAKGQIMCMCKTSPDAKLLVYF